MIYYDGLKFDIEIKYEVYLLNKYLIKHYNEETAKTLLNKYNSELDILAQALGERDIEFFCLYFMSDTFIVKDSNTNRELAKGHYELWDVANNIFVKDLYDKAAIIEPRGMAKTTIFDMAVSVWLHCYKKSLFTLLGAKTDTDATQFLDSIKKIFNENKKIVKAPMVGTFYLKPSPTSEAYVEIGKTVKKGDTLCIIEAMKLMNEIESEFDGKIIEICVKDGEAVEYGKPLFVIE